MLHCLDENSSLFFSRMGFFLSVTLGLDQSFPSGSLQKAAGPWAAIGQCQRRTELPWGERMVPGQHARARPGPGEAAARAGNRGIRQF